MNLTWHSYCKFCDLFNYEYFWPECEGCTETLPLGLMETDHETGDTFKVIFDELCYWKNEGIVFECDLFCDGDDFNCEFYTRC